MDVTTGAMGVLPLKLEKLLEEAGEHKKSQLKRAVDSIDSKLDDIQAGLCKLAEVPHDRQLGQKDMEAKLWARAVREKSYKMEDDIDMFIKMGLGAFAGNIIEKIHDRVKALHAQQESYSVDSVAANSATSTVHPHLSSWYRKKATKLVGVGKRSKKLIKMLTDESERLKVVSVVGPRGLGKTTLADQVYNKLKPQFHCGAFISMGPHPDMKKLLLDVLLQLSSKDYGATTDEKQLFDELRIFLENKRYLIVIDDICNSESWEGIRCALADSTRGGRVIATTRISEVVTNAGDNVCKLKPLSDNKSKELFYRATFGVEEKYQNNDHLAKVSNRIDLKKCCGQPLAILTIASMLAGKPMDEWSRVYHSIDFGPKDTWHVENITSKISLSYYGLPSHLRTCLLYLSIFPEDHWIEKDALIWKWIAEGFVRTEQGKGSFKVGEGYFSELKNRSLIQPLDKYSNKCFMEGCRVHDVVLDQIRSISREENFVRIFDIEQHNFVRIFDIEQHMSPESKVRRLAIQGGRVEDKLEANTSNIQALRSLVVTGCDRIGAILSVSIFRVLRVLELVRCSFMEGRHLNGVGYLYQLRYLGLEGTPILELPEEVGKLSFLQTLDLRGSGIEELPSTIGQLGQLMCLWADDKTRVAANCVGQLTSLEDLQLQVYNVDRPTSFVQELGRLTELRALKIGLDRLDDESLENSLLVSLCNLRKMETLEIYRCASSLTRTSVRCLPRLHDIRHLSLQGICFARLPTWITSSSAPNLSRLAVAVEVLEEADSQVLGSLPELTCLNLAVGPYSYREDQEYKILTSVVDRGDGAAFEKLRFCTTNVPPRFLLPKASQLQVLQFGVKVEDAHADLGLGLPWLEQVTVLLNCWGARAEEVEEAEAALRRAADANPNRPAIEVIRENQGCKVLSRIPLTERLRTGNPRFHLLGPELAKMRANQEFLRRIQLNKELSQLDDDLDQFPYELA